MNKNGICKSAGNQFWTCGYGGERIKQQPYSLLLDIDCIRYENIVFSTRNDSILMHGFKIQHHSTVSEIHL